MREKTIFISHSTTDNSFALELGTLLEERVGKDSVWVDFFDIEAGDELAPMISQAIGKAKWFILIASQNSMRSRWVEHEAKLAVFESIEKDDFEIITIKIEDCTFPTSIGLELKSRRYLDATINKRAAIEEIANLISSRQSTRTSTKNAFIDRGQELDSLELAFSQSRIIYLVGWSGIGKTSVVNELANLRLGRPYLKIDLTQGHDVELFSRQIIGLTGNLQPAKNIPLERLIERATDCLRHYEVTTNGFLVVDDGENGMTETGEFRPFMRKIIDLFGKSTSNPLLVILRERPDISLEDAANAYIQIIQPLPDPFVKTVVERIYFAITSNAMPNEISLDRIIPSIGGHPLAAKFLASYLAFEGPEILNRSRFISTFRHNVAEYILQTFIGAMGDLEVKTLEVLAICQAGLTINDLVAIKLLQQIAQGGSEKILETLSALSKRLLIVQEGELIRLHPFINAFFVNKANEDGITIKIATELSAYTFEQVRNVSEKLSKLDPNESKTANEYRDLSSRLVRYAVPAHRLLLLIGQEAKAEKLPFLLKGQIRRMVFDYYQIHKDYEAVVRFANEWLKIENNDGDILIYKARALRRLGQYEEAEKILQRISVFPGKRFQAMVAREHGYIARDNGDLETAIYHFGHASSLRNSKGIPFYPISLADNASVLVQKANSEGMLNPDRDRDFQQAVTLFEESQKYLSNFDQHHLPAYVDALINIGQETKAVSLLVEALAQYPNHPLLNLRMADFLRKNPEQQEEAYRHAESAYKNGQLAGLSVMATIRLDQGRPAETLKLMEKFNPRNSTEEGVYKTTIARAYIDLNQLDDAEKVLEGDGVFKDPRLLIAKINLTLTRMENFFYSGKVSDAHEAGYQCDKLLEVAETEFPYHTQFDTLRTKLRKLRQNKASESNS